MEREIDGKTYTQSREVESGKRKSMAYNIITTGSRGKWSQFKQIAIGKGYVADVFKRDEVLVACIGYTPEWDDYFNMAYNRIIVFSIDAFGKI